MPKNGNFCYRELRNEIDILRRLKPVSKTLHDLDTLYGRKGEESLAPRYMWSVVLTVKKEILRGSLMNRREFIYASGAFAAASLGSVYVARAFDLKHSPESVHDNLSRAMWASTNRKGKRVAYVIAAPWCPVCKALYQEILSTSPDCDFRFVWQNARNRQQDEVIYSTYFYEGDNQLIPFERSEPQVAGVTDRQIDLAAGINEATVSSVGHFIRPFLSGGGGSGGGFGWGYPTIIFKTGGKVRAVTGMPSNLDSLVASIDPGIDRPTQSPELMKCVATPFDMFKGSGSRFAQQPNVKLYAAPTVEAPVVEVLGKGAGYGVHAQANYGGKDWLAFQAFPKPWPLLWGDVKQF